MKIEKLNPSCNLDTVRDGRGGIFTYLPSHVFLAISDCTLIVLLTKKWDDCDVPIVHENLGMGKGDHGDPDSDFHKK